MSQTPDQRYQLPVKEPFFRTVTGSFVGGLIVFFLGSTATVVETTALAHSPSPGEIALLVATPTITLLASRWVASQGRPDNYYKEY